MALAGNFTMEIPMIEDDEVSPEMMEAARKALSVRFGECRNQKQVKATWLRFQPMMADMSEQQSKELEALYERALNEVGEREAAPPTVGPMTTEKFTPEGYPDIDEMLKRMPADGRRALFGAVEKSLLAKGLIRWTGKFHKGEKLWELTERGRKLARPR